MALKILYQDQWLVVVDKPAGMLVHPGREPESSDQIAMKVLRDQIGQRVSTVHRLDRPTSGVLMFALEERIEIELRRQFEEKTVEKNYVAVVLGETPEHWTSRTPLQKNEDEPFRDAETHFTRNRLCRIGDETFSVLTATPRTGRFHQIRKHLAAEDFPIVGDYLHGDPITMDRVASLIGQSRLMLHASSLRFHHPAEGIDRDITCRLPERFSPFS